MNCRFVWLTLSDANERPTAWRSPYHPGITVRRCARLIALRPYYIEGLPIERRFRNALQAQTAVEQYERGNALATAHESLRCPVCNKTEVTQEQLQRGLIAGCRCDECGGCGWLRKPELEAPRVHP